MLLTSLSSRDKVCTLEHISHKNSPRVEEKSAVPYKTLSLPIYLNSCDIATVAGNKNSQGRELNSPLLHYVYLPCRVWGHKWWDQIKARLNHTHKERAEKGLQCKERSCVMQ